MDQEWSLGHTGGLTQYFTQL